MRVVVDRWILTTLNGKTKVASNNDDESAAIVVDKNNNSQDDDEEEDGGDDYDEYIIEQEIKEDLNLYHHSFGNENSGDELSSSFAITDCKVTTDDDKNTTCNTKTTKTTMSSHTRTEKSIFKVYDKPLLVDLKTNISTMLTNNNEEKNQEVDATKNCVGLVAASNDDSSALSYRSCIYIDNVKYYFKDFDNKAITNNDNVNTSNEENKEEKEEEAMKPVINNNNNELNNMNNTTNKEQEEEPNKQESEDKKEENTEPTAAAAAAITPIIMNMNPSSLQQFNGLRLNLNLTNSSSNSEEDEIDKMESIQPLSTSSADDEEKKRKEEEEEAIKDEMIKNIRLSDLMLSNEDASFTKRTWLSLLDTIKPHIDAFSLREVKNLIEEFIKLENYLNGESMLNEQENKAYKFANQKEIINYVNKTLKVKLFHLSQSTALYDELKFKFERLLRSRLGDLNLVEILNLYEQVDHDYNSLFELTKSKLKLKMAKFENLINIWDEFEANCRQLDILFLKNNADKRISSNLQYRALLIEMNNYLNELKEALAHLTPICSEKAYFDLKNQIIIFGLKYDDFKTKNENYLSSDSKLLNNNDDEQQQPAEMTKSFIMDDNEDDEITTKFYCDSCKTNKNKEGNDNNNNNNNNNNNKPIAYYYYKRPEMCDKCIATVHEIGTQTDKSELDEHHHHIVEEQRLSSLSPANYSSLDSSPIHHHHHSKLKKRRSNENDEINKKENLNENNQIGRSLDKLLQHSSNIISNTESDGKQLLLEAYLRNNNESLINQKPVLSSAALQQQQQPVSATNNHSSGTGSSSINIATNKQQQRKTKRQHKQRNKQVCETTPAGTITTARESGICTLNDDDDDDDDDGDYDYEYFSPPEQKEEEEEVYVVEFNPIDKLMIPNKTKNNNRRRANNNKSLLLKPVEIIVDDDKNESSDLGIDVDDEHHCLKQKQQLLKQPVVDENRLLRQQQPPDENNNDLFASSELLDAKVTTDDPPAYPTTTSSSASSTTSHNAVENGSLTAYFKRIFAFILFLLPIILLLVVLMFYHFINRPYGCCDFKRDYLLFNIS